MTSKQRAYLRGLANSIDAIFQIGKGGISDNLINQLNDALEARELIKITVLENAPDSVRPIAEEIAERTNSTLVQTIGSKVTLYKARKKDSKIILPN
ncbi:MAG: ribosome assembly RNA-binding protein YhbY [Clostridiaceae bacterium]|nr:ribosome assembly RNA-binding protein YhbY [Clostridiaceae bacterium]